MPTIKPVFIDKDSGQLVEPRKGDTFINNPDFAFNNVQELLDFNFEVETDDPFPLSANLLGFYEVGDGGGSAVYWAPNEDKANHNGGTIINPDHDSTIGSPNWYSATGDATDTTGDGCWKRVNTDVINAKWFGLKADWDGSTGSDDSFRIQAAVDLEKPVYIPDGDYYISSTIEIGNVRQELELADSASLNVDSDITVIKVRKTGIVIDSGSIVQHNASRVGTGIRYAAGDDPDDGVDNGNVQFCKTYDLEISGFEKAIHVSSITAVGAALRGFAYATLEWKRLFDNKYHLYFETDGEGWINSNQYMGYQILNPSVITDGRAVYVSNNGDAFIANRFRGNFEKCDELYEEIGTPNNNTSGISFIGYFEQTGKNLLSGANEIYIEDWRNRHEITELYAGNRLFTTFVAANSNKQGGNAYYGRINSTDSGNDPKLRYYTDNFPDLFGVFEDGSGIEYRGGKSQFWNPAGGLSANASDTIDLCKTDVANYITVEIVATNDSVENTVYYEKIAISTQSSDNTYASFVVSSNGFAAADVQVIDDGGSPPTVQLFIDNNTGRFLRYKVMVRGAHQPINPPF